jgi:hypothetical protein
VKATHLLTAVTAAPAIEKLNRSWGGSSTSGRGTLLRTAAAAGAGRSLAKAAGRGNVLRSGAAAGAAFVALSAASAAATAIRRRTVEQ